MIEGGTKDKKGVFEEIRAFGEVRASLLLILDFFAGPWAPPGSTYFSVKLTRRLIQKLHFIRDPKAIAKDKSLLVFFSSRLTDLLDIKFLKL